MENKRVFSFDLIRCLAIFAIVFFHFESAVFHVVGKEICLPWFELIGKAGVSMFFILSGATLFLNNDATGKVEVFFKKRFLAIYPLFWITYCFYFFLGVLLGRLPFSVASPVTAILTFVGLDGFMSYKFSTFYLVGEWFLGTIVILYCLFPLARYLVNKNIYIVLALCLTIILILKSYYSFDMPLLRYPLFRLFEFVFGIYIGGFLLKDTNKNKLVNCGLILLITFLCFFFHPSTKYFLKVIYLGMICFILLMLFSEVVSWNIFRKTIVFLSAYSYGVFLVHHHIVDNIVIRAASYIENPFYHVFLIFIAVMLSIFLSMILTHFSRLVVNYVRSIRIT